MLKIAAVLFLLLAGLALEASGAESSSEAPMREIDAEEIVEKIEAGQPVEYDHVIVRGDLDLSRERLHRNITSPIRINDSIFDSKVSFNGRTFEKTVDLHGSNFTRDANFREAEFSDDAHFSCVEFSDGAYFRGADFKGDAYFSWADFRDYANFGKVDFRGDAHFSCAEFSDDVYFRGGHFRGYADFSYAEFRGYAYFGFEDFSSDDDPYLSGATFRGDANFRGAHFLGYADFRRAIFRSDADFGYEDLGLRGDTRATSFGGNAVFSRAHFLGYVYFIGTDFKGDADFDGVDFKGDADFKGAKFSSYADFMRADFTGNSSFEDVEFNGNIEFGDARFENENSFYRILFKRPAYFENCFIKSLNLTKAEYSRLQLRWDDIESLHFDEAAYLALIKNYNTLGWYGDANRCYYDYRNAVRKNWRTASSTGFEARILKLFDLLIDYMEWLLYGYGVRPIIPISWSAIIILAFGLFFWHKRCLRKLIVEERIEDSKDASDEVLVKTTARRAEINALDPILFSLFTFTSGFTAFLHPSIEYKLERCMRWAIFERLLGTFFMALVITAISKTYLIR